ncbi:MAG TPA: hypothetical protein VKB94_00515, partial [Rhizomicrobium sp.]|nr:hypothetical protein [Rhizomicrobium sp.]
MNRRWLAVTLLGLVTVLLLLLLWLTRAFIAVQFARSYFASHGVVSSVEIGELGLSGVSGRFSLGPRDAPEVSAEHIELRFDPLRWLPYVVEVRLVNPVVRARLDANGKLTVGSLQEWIDSLSRQQGKSRFVSDDLAVSLTGMRLLLATPGGALEMSGNARLVKNLPVSLALRARPARIVTRDLDVTMRAASLAFDQNAGTLAAQFSGAVKHPMVDTQGIDAKVDATGFKWSSARGSATSVSLHVTAASVAAGQKLSTPALDVTARNVTIVSANGRLEGAADLAVTAAAGVNAALAPLRAADSVIANAIRQNLARLTLVFAGRAERRAGVARFALTQPLLVTGARGGVLHIPALTLSGTADRLHMALDASLTGPGLPAARLGMRNLVWSGGGFTTDTTLSARFNFAMLRGTDMAGQGTFSWQNGQYAFTPSGCVHATLAAFHPGAGDLAKNVRGDICARPNQPLLTGEGIGWTLTGQARNASADLPLAIVHAENIAAKLDFDGEGAPLRGTATITAGQIVDRAATLRFKPLQGSGTASLANGVWRGRFAVTEPRNVALGEATFVHTMATG